MSSLISAKLYLEIMNQRDNFAVMSYKTIKGISSHIVFILVKEKKIGSSLKKNYFRKTFKINTVKSSV